MLNLKELFKKRPFIYYIDGEYYALGAGVCSCAYSARTAHPFQRNGAPFRFKLSKAQQVD